MRVKEGDILVCNNGKYEFQLKVVRTCSPEVYGEEVEYDFEVLAGGQSVILYKYEN
jgi:saccharopine dehydrogenase-like NADP-dependent oxidoreductase